MKKLSKRNEVVESTVVAFDACYKTCMNTYGCKHNGTAGSECYKGTRANKSR